MYQNFKELEYQELPEQAIKSAIDLGRGMNMGVSTFEEILRIGEEYKKADMTPIYLLYRGEETIRVVAEETFGKKLH